MVCKYLIVISEEGERPIIFADDMFFHDQVGEICDGNEIISAGFVTIGPDGNINCFGKSESLNIPSRGLDDEIVIRHQFRSK
jgi:hypothetical protein